MATLLVPETYTTIQAAVNAASAGDTISVAPGNYPGLVDCYYKACHIEGRDPTDWSAVTITNTPGYNGYVVRMNNGASIKHCTIYNTAAGTSSTNTAVQIYGGTVEHCRIWTNNTGVWTLGAGAEIIGCVIESLVKSTGTATWGIKDNVGGNYYSSLILDFNNAQIYNYGKGNVINCTIQTSYRRNAVLRGIYAENIYNCIYHNNSGLTGYNGIEAKAPGVIRNCISYGETTDFAGTTIASYNSAAVAGWGGSTLFVDEAAKNFNINAGSIAENAGTYLWQTTYGAPLLDLNGNVIDPAAPDIGAMQVVAPAGGGGGNHKIRLTCNNLRLKF